MARGRKFIGFFFVFMFTGILIAGIAAGNLEIKKDITTSMSPETAYQKLSDTANLNIWISHLQKIEPDEIPGTYKIYLHTGKPKAAVMDLLPEADSLKRTVEYHISNKGSKLIIHFKIQPGTVSVKYAVEGKGVANKIVLSMLKKSLKEQYKIEMERIEKFLNP